MQIRGKRITTKITILLFGLSVFLGGTGCASRRAYNEGEEMYKTGNYDRSVECFHKAVTLSPDNDKYKASLKMAQQRAAQRYYAQSQECFQGTSLTEAKNYLEKAVVYDSSNQEIILFREKIVERMNFADNCRKQAFACAEKNQWDDAIKQMRSFLAAHKDYPGGDAELDKYLETASLFYLQLSQKALAEGNWDKSEKLALKTKEFGKRDKDGDDVLAEIANRREAKKMTETGKQALLKKELAEALKCFTTARKLYPRQPGIDQQVSDTEKAVCLNEIQTGNEDFSLGKYFDALDHYSVSKQTLNEFGDVDKFIRKTKDKLAAINLEKSKAFFSKGLYGNAFLSLVLARSYQSDLAEIAPLINQVKEKIKERIHYKFALIPVFTRNELNKLNEQLAALAWADANVLCPRSAEILSLEISQKLINEQQISPQDIIKNHILQAEIKNIDGIIIISIEDFSISKNTVLSSYGKSEFEDGVKIVDNPQYAEAQQRVNEALQKLQAVRNNYSGIQTTNGIVQASPLTKSPIGVFMALSKVGNAARENSAANDVANAEAELATAQSILASTQYQISVPNRFIATYPIYSVTAIGNLKGSIYYFDTMSQTIIHSGQINGECSASDRYIQGDTAKNIPNDPLELPTQETFENSAVQIAVGKIRNHLDVSLKQHGNRYVLLARKEKERGNKENMVEYCINYIGVYPDKTELTPEMLTLLNDVLGSEAKFVNLDAELHRKD